MIALGEEIYPAPPAPLKVTKWCQPICSVDPADAAMRFKKSLALQLHHFELAVSAAYDREACVLNNEISTLRSELRGSSEQDGVRSSLKGVHGQSCGTGILKAQHDLHGKSGEALFLLPAPELERELTNDTAATLPDEPLPVVQGKPRLLPALPNGVNNLNKSEDPNDEHHRLMLALGDHLENVGRTLSEYVAAESDGRNAAKVLHPGTKQTLSRTLSSLISGARDELCKLTAATDKTQSSAGTTDDVDKHESSGSIVQFSPSCLSTGLQDSQNQRIHKLGPLKAREGSRDVGSDGKSSPRSTVVSVARSTVASAPWGERPDEDSPSQITPVPPVRRSRPPETRWRQWRGTMVTSVMQQQTRESLESYTHFDMGHVSPKALTTRQRLLKILEFLVAVILMSYSLVLALSVDIAWDGWKYVEYGFTVFFISELSAKLCLQHPAEFFRGELCHWNMFDVVVVLIAVADSLFSILGSNDIKDLQIVKVIKVGRLARLLRLLRYSFLKDLKQMIAGVAAGLRVLFWALVLFFIFIFMLAITVRQLLGPGFEEEGANPMLSRSFESMTSSMNTIYMCFMDDCTASDGTPLQVHIYQDQGFIVAFASMLIMLFVTIGLFNLIMATFVDNVLEKARQRKVERRAKDTNRLERLLRQTVIKHTQPSRSDTTSHLLSAEEWSNMFKLQAWRPKSLFGEAKWVPKASGLSQHCPPISREEFHQILKKPEVQQVLLQLDIETSHQDELFDCLDADMSGQLDFDELIVGLMSLRGPAEKKDVIASLLCIRATQQYLREALEVSKDQIRASQDQIRADRKSVV